MNPTSTPTLFLITIAIMMVIIMGSVSVSARMDILTTKSLRVPNNQPYTTTRRRLGHSVQRRAKSSKSAKGATKKDAKGGKVNGYDHVIPKQGLSAPKPSDVITPFCGSETDGIDPLNQKAAGAFCKGKGLFLPTENEACKYHMHTDVLWESLATNKGILDVPATCPKRPRICPELGQIWNEDNEELDPDLPKPTKCQMKRKDMYLWTEPKMGDEGVFPPDRTDVFIEVLIPSTNQIFQFHREDRYVQWREGIIPFDAGIAKDVETYSIIFNEQEKEGGMGFKMRYNGKRGPGAWNSCSYSPIAFDLNRDGKVGHITRPGVGFKIDITGDGEQEHLSEWFAPEEGILIDIHNEDGLIDFENGIITGDHMMGDMAGKYTDGFAKLATYDDNCDDKLTGKELDGLYIWRDINSNMVLDEGELKTLAYYDIVSLNTVHDDLKAYAELGDGSTMLMQDLWFDAFQHERRLASERRLQVQHWGSECKKAILCSNIDPDVVPEPEPQTRSVDPTPKKAPPPSESCGTPPALPSGLSFGEYSGNPQCVSGGSDMPFGFEYGWKMAGCQDGTFLLDAVPMNGGEIKGSCAAASTIEVSVTCNADKSATISWSGVGNSLLVIKMKGGNGGVLYDPTTAVNGGKFYPLPGKGISHIEVCIQCDDCPGMDSEEDPEPEPSPISPPAPDSPSPDDQTTKKAFTKGDPHFKTFGGELYDFHGECDLVLLHNPDFQDGLGMDIHIRTKIEAFWSSVESAVIKLGDDTMEIRADPNKDEWIWFNGQAPTGVEKGKWQHNKVSDFLVRYKDSDGTRGRGNTREANLYIQGGAKEPLVFKTFKGFLRIDINWQGSDSYYNSVGLLGSHAHEGKRLGRNGKFIADVNAFGQDWQVIPEVDGSLFHSYAGAVVGKKCTMPPAYHEGDSLVNSSRRLGVSSVDQAAAEAACSHLVDPEEQKACVFDVVSTQDLNMASTW